MGYFCVVPKQLAGEKYIKILQNRALCDKFLKFCMVIDMDTRFSKTIASKLRLPARGLFARNPVWPPPIKVNSILRLLFALQPCAIPLLECFGARIPFVRSFLCFKVSFKMKGHFQRHLAQKVAVKNDFLYFSFIVLISMHTNYNISTIGNYQYKFDTKTCTFIFREFRESKIQIIVCATCFTLAPWATANLQLPLHATKHPQWSSSMHPRLASGRSVQ